MSGDQPRDVAAIQDEINRQALVEIGKRLTGLEHKCSVIESEVKDLHYFTASSLETATRVRKMLKRLIAERKVSEPKGTEDSED